MNNMQWRRMSVFAIRMVAITTTPRHQANLRELLKRFLDRIYSNNSVPGFLSWDHSANDDDELLTDEVKRFIWDMEDEGVLPKYNGARESAFAGHLNCCVRAGCDIGCEPSAGVVGFTVGDVRRMWKGRNVPQWVKDAYEFDLDALPDTTPIGL